MTPCEIDRCKNEENNPTASCFLHILRIAQKIERSCSANLESKGITLSQFDVLTTLLHCEGVTQQELACKLLVTKGNMCGLLDRMTEKDLIERRDDPSDRRVYRLFLTKKGRTLVENLLPEQRAFMKTMVHGFREEEQHQLHTLLHHLDQDLPDTPSAVYPKECL